MQAADKLIVARGQLGESQPGTVYPEERVELIARRVVAKLPNVEADCSSTLIAEYAR